MTNTIQGHKIGASRFLCFSALIFFIAFAARGINQWKSTPILLAGDEPEYAALAETLFSNWRFESLEMNPSLFQCGKSGEPTAYRSPVLPFFLATHHLIFGRSLTWPRLTLIILASVVSIFLAIIGKLIDHSFAGLIAAALWAINPPSIFGAYSSDRLYPESLSAFFLTGALTFLVLTYKRPSYKYIIISALFLGLAILSRGYLLFILPLCILFLYFFQKAHKWGFILLLTIVTSLVFGSWVIRNRLVIGKFILSTQTEHFYIGNNLWARGSFYGDFFTEGFEAPQLKIILNRYPGFLNMSELECSEIWTREALRSITDHPEHFAWLLIRKTLVFWGPFQFWSRGLYGYHYLFSFILLFAIYEVARKWPTESRGYYLLLLIPIIGVYISALMTYGFDRYRYMIEPFVYMLGAMGIIRIANTIHCFLSERFNEENGRN